MVRSIDPIVSAEWLEAKLSGGGLTVIDIRWEEEYQAGHIPGAISVPFAVVSAWADSDDELILELPPDADLLKLVGDCGLTAESRVVVVGQGGTATGPAVPLGGCGESRGHSHLRGSRECRGSCRGTSEVG